MNKSGFQGGHIPPIAPTKNVTNQERVCYFPLAAGFCAKRKFIFLWSQGCISRQLWVHWHVTKVRLNHFVSNHTTSRSSTWIGVWYAGTSVYSADFTNTYYHPSPVHIRWKKPVCDGREQSDLGTYQSLDEGQREMLKEYGFAVNIAISQ